MALPKKLTIRLLVVQTAWMLVASAAEAPIHPSLEQAQLNAFPIFNSIHSAMRQWGSSLNHNGMALIPAKVPNGSLLYHGTHSSDVRTTGLEWLAFEPEHSEAFAASWRARQKKGMAVPEQAVLQGVVDPDQSFESLGSAATPPAIRGYLRTYQASRDLNLLYLDGMSAAKGCLGTLDTQDLVMRTINGTSPCDSDLTDILKHEMERLGDLCGMITPWGYDGVIRMEVGFEIVYCDFDDGGLRLLTQVRRPFWDQMKPWYNIPRLAFHIIRAATQHYDGMFEAARVQLDFSRMVSAYFYPVNLTDPSIDADGQAPARLLPRLLSTTYHERQTIRHRVQEVAVARDSPAIEWQAVVDAIVSRYADRLTLLANLSPARLDSDADRFAAEVFVATNTYVDYPTTPDDATIVINDADGEAEARTKCQSHYLQQVESNKYLFTPEDHLIHAAITQVTRRICDTLFQARSYILEAYQSELHGREARKGVISRAAAQGQHNVHKLVSDLQWTIWEKCKDCAVGEVCFLPMFPFGSTEDHLEGPRCLNESGRGWGLNLSDNYWQVDGLGALKTLTEPF